VDSGCTSNLAWEVEKYGTSSGELEAWVKMPQLSNGGTTFYMCYGKSSISSFQSTASAVWSNGYAGVWHLPNGSALSGIDSTTHANGTPEGNPTAVAGVVDGAASFNASNDINMGTNSVLTITGPLSISAWVKPSAACLAPTQGCGFLGNSNWGGAPGHGYHLGWYTGAGLYFIIEEPSGGGNVLAPFSYFTANTWAYVPAFLTALIYQFTSTACSAAVLRHPARQPVLQTAFL